MSKIIVPVDMAIVRNYRVYVTVEDDMPDVAIKEAAVQEVMKWQDNALTPIDDLDIEIDDIWNAVPRMEESWTVDEAEEIREILRSMKED